jgi:hypothetical protein
MRRAQAWALVAVAAIAFTACGSEGGKGAADDVASLAADGDDPDATTGASDPSTTVAGDESPADPEEAMLEYTQCMRDQGIDLPDPVRVESADGGRTEGGVIAINADAADDGAGIDPRSDEFNEAQEACGSIMDDVIGDIEIDPEQEAEMRERLLDYAECMREQGIDYPDPVFEDGRVTVGVGPVDMDMDEFEQANEACREIMGDGPFSISVAAGDAVGG